MVPCNTRGVRTRSLSLQIKWDKLIIRSPFCRKTIIRCRLNGANICLCQVGHCGNGAEHATSHLLCAGSSDSSVVTGARSNNQATKLPPHSRGLLSVRQAVHILYNSLHFVLWNASIRECSHKWCQNISPLHVVSRHPYNSPCSCARNKFLVFCFLNHFLRGGRNSIHTHYMHHIHWTSLEYTNNSSSRFNSVNANSDY